MQRCQSQTRQGVMTELPEWDKQTDGWMDRRTNKQTVLNELRYYLMSFVLGF